MDSSAQNTASTLDYSSLTLSVIRSILIERQCQDQAQKLSTKEKQINQQEDEIHRLKAKLHLYEEQFNLLRHQRFSKSSETATSLQLSLFDESEEVVETENAETQEISYTRKKPHRSNKNLDTSRLKREFNIIDLDDTQKQCACGQELQCFGQESKEELVYIPATMKVIEHIRYKYSCKTCNTVKMPPALELPLSKSKAGASLLTEVILNKYDYHLPLYRQSKMLSSHLLEVPDSTLGGWVMGCAEQLSPIYEAMWLMLQCVDVLQVDESPVKVLDPHQKGYVWLYHCYLRDKRFVLFEFSLNRSASVVNHRLKDYKGLLQSDGYSGYNTQRSREEVVTLGCWDHCRRKFTDVIKACGNNKTGKAGDMLKKIAKLYEIEKEIRGKPYSDRKRLRQEKAKPKLEAIFKFLQKINAPPSSLLYKAVTYCKNQWPELIRYVDYGEAEISNCWAENLIRPLAIGRKNWLFVGNEVSGQRAAMLYSLIQSCHLNGIDPRKYLNYVLNQVHRIRRRAIDPATLLPCAIDKALLENS